MTTMSTNFVQEQLSWAAVRAVSSQAGFNLDRLDIDDHGIDGTLRSYEPGFLPVDFQLKSTTNYFERDGNIVYDLRVENFNVLVQNDSAPRILILFVMPPDREDWLSQTPEQLCLRRCAYWVSLMERRPSSNTETVRVELSMDDVFSVDGLPGIFERLARLGGGS